MQPKRRPRSPVSMYVAFDGPRAPPPRPLPPLNRKSSQRAKDEPQSPTSPVSAFFRLGRKKSTGSSVSTSSRSTGSGPPPMPAMNKPLPPFPPPALPAPLGQWARRGPRAPAINVDELDVHDVVAMAKGREMGRVVTADDDNEELEEMAFAVPGRNASPDEERTDDESELEEITFAVRRRMGSPGSPSSAPASIPSTSEDEEMEDITFAHPRSSSAASMDSLGPIMFANPASPTDEDNDRPLEPITFAHSNSNSPSHSPSLVEDDSIIFGWPPRSPSPSDDHDDLDHGMTFAPRNSLFSLDFDALDLPVPTAPWHLQRASSTITISTIAFGGISPVSSTASLPLPRADSLSLLSHRRSLSASPAFVRSFSPDSPQWRPPSLGPSFSPSPGPSPSPYSAHRLPAELRWLDLNAESSSDDDAQSGQDLGAWRLTPEPIAITVDHQQGAGSVRVRAEKRDSGKVLGEWTVMAI
ncbi:hypothetical protein MIND_00393900 [Mycena indigotica]|uniref:Uncharacterized protein n=1 Tax=Mycena indigotica TaxID=2126181 RepID=A0A8H6WCX4_9AGAR|nr:uncharacterized protein MIND_00393900 [Mycena indigotica]KAF7310203.1 hypothetical protein MIND_00393900 [Mycena indigotica]